MEKNLKIRAIRLEDAEDIERISIAISKDVADIDFKKLLDHKIKEGGEETSLVAEIGGKVAGYMISNTLYAGFGLKKSAWIVTMGVAPQYMGRGIGVKLAEDIFEVYRKKGIKHIYSSVMWDSIDLLSFFKTLGFERSNFINLRKEL
ncbi:MAG: GNAT family N-acetyltransferase [Thermodesulfobacteriota bacterium]|nr:GNAT family N-acetyltransferase [Thermodesulfobacteriota bacterium]